MCDSHHVNEDTMERTYLAAVKQMADNADAVIEVVRGGALLTMEPENNEKLAAAEQAIIQMQERVLDLHQQKVAHKITDAQYNAAIQKCSQQMQQLEAQQAELQTVAIRYAEVRGWLDTFETNIRTGEIMSANDTIKKGSDEKNDKCCFLPAIYDVWSLFRITSAHNGFRLSTLVFFKICIEQA